MIDFLIFIAGVIMVVSVIFAISEILTKIVLYFLGDK